MDAAGDGASDDDGARFRAALADLRAAFPRTRDGCDALCAHAMRCCMSDPECNPDHHAVRYLCWGLSEEALRGELERAIASLGANGTGAAVATPADVLRRIEALLPTLTCSAACSCACHACADECLDERALCTLCDDTQPGATSSWGVRWGILGLMPTTAFAPALKMWVRLADLTAPARPLASVPPFAHPVRADELLGATCVGALPAPDPHRHFLGVDFVAAERMGASVVHTVVLGLHEHEPPWYAVLAHDPTDGNRRYLFEVDTRVEPGRVEEVRPRELLAAIDRLGHVAFCIYTVLRSWQPTRASFGRCLDAHAAAPTRAREALAADAKRYAEAALRVYNSERMVHALRQALRGVQRSGADLQKLAPRQRVFTGAVDASVDRGLLLDCAAEGLRLRHRLHGRLAASLAVCRVCKPAAQPVPHAAAPAASDALASPDSGDGDVDPAFASMISSIISEGAASTSYRVAE